MRAARNLIPCLLAVAALAAPASAFALTPGEEMVNRINGARANAGLGPVAVMPTLTASAARYAHWMMRVDYFGHVRHIRASNAFDRLGEVLERHRGRRARVRLAFRRWMRSPGHRAVLLNPRLHFVGVGRVKGRFRGRRATIWVGHFGGGL